MREHLGNFLKEVPQTPQELSKKVIVISGGYFIFVFRCGDVTTFFAFPGGEGGAPKA